MSKAKKQRHWAIVLVNTGEIMLGAYTESQANKMCGLTDEIVVKTKKPLPDDVPAKWMSRSPYRIESFA